MNAWMQEEDPDGATAGGAWASPHRSAPRPHEGHHDHEHDDADGRRHRHRRHRDRHVHGHPGRQRRRERHSSSGGHRSRHHHHRGRSHDDRRHDHHRRSHSHASSRTKKDRSSRKDKDHRTKEEKLTDLYKNGWIPSPELLPAFSPKYLYLNGYIEITARRGSGKTTLFNEIMDERARDFSLVIIFSSTENVNSAFSGLGHPAFTHTEMNLTMIDNLLSLRERQLGELDLLKQHFENIGDTDSKRYKDVVRRLEKRRNQHICLFFDDMTADKKLLNNTTFRRLSRMGRHYGVCVIINKQSDVNTERNQRNQVDAAILFETNDENELKRAYETQFHDMRLFPTMRHFERAHQKYCSQIKGGCLIHISTFDPRVPSYIKNRYRTFAYQTRDLPKDKIRPFLSHRVRLYGDAVYVPHKLLEEYTQEKKATRDLRWYAEDVGAAGGVPRKLPPASPHAVARGQQPSSGQGRKGRGGAHSRKKANAEEETDPTEPVKTDDGKLRIATDPKGDLYWNARY